MNKFFKGQITSGAWSCFDEFNRIDTEVLSVVGQMVNQILNAIKEKKENFQFDGEDIDVNLGLTINITMNPDYVGRKPLPDNLKALFRTVAMMIPDYNLIAEIFLYSSGFQNATYISKKLVAANKLASEQLSS